MNQELQEISNIRFKLTQLENENQTKVNLELEISKFHTHINSLREKINTMNYDNEIFDIREQFVKLS